VALALSHRLAIYSAHTNLDASPGGMNRTLASLLGLTGCRVLEASPARLFKVAVFVPAAAREKVREALFSGGAGEIGAYDRCSFATGGEGTFRPGPGARPAIGRKGREERVAETRLEAVVEDRALARVLTAVRAAHPYEEPAIDVFSLHATGMEEGIGLVGELGSPVAACDLAAALAGPLSLTQVRMVGDANRKVRRVAVCTGSGGSLLGAAIRSGAELYITGDVGYHLARRAEEAGLALCDLGHYPPERFGMEQFARALGKALRTAGAAVEVVMAREKDPFTLYFPPESAGGSRATTRRKKQ
jgi:dinuclear metal center YbgI/SA1388 family protein